MDEKFCTHRKLGEPHVWNPEPFEHINGWRCLTCSAFTVKDPIVRPSQDAITGGAHYDEGKPRVDLLEAEFLLGMGRVMAYGAKKYKETGGARNYRKGILVTKLLGSCMRHLLAALMLEDADKESGEHPLFHVAACAMMCWWNLVHVEGSDDR